MDNINNYIIELDSVYRAISCGDYTRAIEILGEVIGDMEYERERDNNYKNGNIDDI